MLNIETWLETTGLKVAEECFVNTPPPLPYINFRNIPDISGADSKNCIANSAITVELYSYKIDKVSEAKIEILLNERAIKYSKEHIWIDTERMMSTIYDFNIIEKF